MTTTFVEIYHPDIPFTATTPARVAAQAVDEYYAKGWLLVDPDALPPAPATPYYTTAAADSRFVQDTQLATKMAGHVGDGSAFDLAQRAAFDARASRKARQLRTAHLGLANRHDDPFKALLIGTSLTEGDGLASRLDGWATTGLARTLRGHFPTDGLGDSGGIGYLPFWGSVVSGSWAWTGGNPLQLSGQGGFFGYRAVYSDFDLTYSFTGTFSSLDVWYYRGPGYGYWRWRLDGGAWTDVPSGWEFPNPTIETIDAGTLAEHTIEIGSFTGGNGVVLGGAYFYAGDEDRGIHVYNSGHTGWKASDFLAPSGDNPAQDYGLFQQHITNLDPHVVLVEFGTNEMGQGVPVATFAADLGQLLDDLIVAAPNASVVPVVAQSFGASSVPYHAAVRDAAEDRDLFCLDWSARMEPNSNTTWYPDGIHPSYRPVQGFIADFTAAELSPPTVV